MSDDSALRNEWQASGLDVPFEHWAVAALLQRNGMLQQQLDAAHNVVKEIARACGDENASGMSKPSFVLLRIAEMKQQLEQAQARHDTVVMDMAASLKTVKHRAEQAEGRCRELEKVCRAVYEEDYQCFVGKDGRLIINCNDVFYPAADAEEVPPDKLDEVLAIIGSTPPDTKDSTVRYDKLMEWVGKQRGAEPFAWRKR